MICHKFSVQLPSSYPEITNNNSKPYALLWWDKAGWCAKQASTESGLLGPCHRTSPSRAKQACRREAETWWTKMFPTFSLTQPRNKEKQHSCVPACIISSPRLNGFAEQYSTRAAILSYSTALGKGTEQPNFCWNVAGYWLNSMAVLRRDQINKEFTLGNWY